MASTWDESIFILTTTNRNLPTENLLLFDSLMVFVVFQKIGSHKKIRKNLDSNIDETKGVEIQVKLVDDEKNVGNHGTTTHDKQTKKA